MSRGAVALAPAEPAPPAGTADLPDTAPRGSTALLFGTALALYLLTVSGHVQTIDVAQSVAVSQQLLRDGSVHITGFADTPGGGAVAGVGGRLYAAHDLGLSLLFLPVSALERWGVLSARQAAFGVTLVNPVLSALLVAVFHRFSLRLTGSAGAAAAAAGVLGAATLVLPYAHVSFDAAPTALFLLLALYLAHRGDTRGSAWRLALGGAAAGAALLVRIDAAIVVGVVCLLVLVQAWRAPTWRATVTRLVAWGLPLLAACLMTAWYDQVRFGDPFDNGHASDPATALTFPLLQGLAGQLLSPGKGVVFFAPPVLLALAGWAGLARRSRPLALTAATAALAYVVFHAKLVNWSGAEAWGPRFLVPVLPYLLLPLALVLARWARQGRGARAVVVVVCALGVLVQVPGVLTNDIAVSRLHGGVLQATPWSRSQVVYAAQALWRSLRGLEPYPSTLEGGIVPPPVPRLDLWWTGGYVDAAGPALGTSRAVAALLAALTVAGALLVVRSVRRAAPVPYDDRAGAAPTGVGAAPAREPGQAVRSSSPGHRPPPSS